MPEPLLNIEHLDAYYGKSHVLQDVNLQVHPGELVVVVGRNGIEMFEKGFGDIGYVTVQPLAPIASERMAHLGFQ